MEIAGPLDGIKCKKNKTSSWVPSTSQAKWQLTEMTDGLMWLTELLQILLCWFKADKASQNKESKEEVVRTREKCQGKALILAFLCD